jgi:hypothetical protein
MNKTLIPKGAGGGDKDDDSLDDDYDMPILSEHQGALNEWVQYKQLVKSGRYFPRKYRKEGLVQIGSISFGVVEERDDDMEASHPFKTRNLADFIDKTGYFDLVNFVGFNSQSFPFIYKLACYLAALRTNEVGCEHFFSIAGYVSNPRQTRLKVKHYKALSMLKLNMERMLIDEDWVVQQFLNMENDKQWDELETRDDEQVAKLELQLYSADCGIPVDNLQFEDNNDDEKVIQEDVEPIPVWNVARKPIEVASSDDDSFG